MTPMLEQAREALRTVMSRHGRQEAVKIIGRVSYGRAKTVPELWPSEWRAVVRACDTCIAEGPTKFTNERENPMTPLKIKMMLHFATVLGPFAPEEVRTSPAYTMFVKELLHDGMIERPTREQRDTFTGWAYKATPKGQCYVKALTHVPLPVRTDPVWAMPV